MDTFYANGIDVDSGTYAVPPLDVEEMEALIRGEKLPDNMRELERRAERPAYLGVKAGVDEKELAQTGWAVVFAEDADPAVEAALAPLLALRQEQAGARYHRYTFRAGETKDSFLARHGAGPGPADPERVPYYLLLVGSPAQIPYSVQSQLDVQYAVGRLDLPAAAGYRTYAQGVVAAENGALKLPRQATFFGVGHQEEEPATKQSLKYLVEPLLEGLADVEGWRLDSVLRTEATKAALARRLGGAASPALLFTAGHGLRVQPGSQSGLSPQGYQGALICADWPGVGHRFEREEYFFAGRDLAPDANLQGLIALFFACFGGGTPRLDSYGRLRRLQMGQDAGPGLALAPEPFVADLPRRLLGSPAGGALAVVGHVDQTWPSSFLWKRQEDGTLPPQTAAWESTLRRLMAGYPLGAAVEYLNSRYAELATMLQPYLEAIKFGDPYDRVEFVNVWMAAVDARWHIVLGDPAVRLPVVDEGEARPRPVPVRAQAAAAPANGPAQPAVEVPTEIEPQGDARFARPFSPPPLAGGELDDLKAQHPDLYQAYVAHVREGYENNGRIFDDVRRAFLRSHNSTVIMYWILFLVGVGAVVAGAVLAVVQREVLAGALFAGLGVASFIGYFITRSVQSVEENLVYITWLGIIYNSYWTHLAWATQRDSAQAELDRATAGALRQLEALLDRHAGSVKARPGLERDDQATPAGSS